LTGLSSFFVFALTTDLTKIIKSEKSKSRKEERRAGKSLIAYLPIAVKTMIVLGDSKGY
jgi:hypothetical protein